ncbi:DUF2723 domain-containing protein [Crateriforma spongiae]|uniref:DUF2723 domain-containing protein n=1 Tax=Crateriforma spongiae TaxID=2724528 RepID=UPI0014459847|nr:DUF2723 domain-containing protein [Crateriforma spongiae]
MTSQTPIAQTNDQIFAIVQRELSTQRRTVHRLALLGAIVMTGIVVALWITEHRPLPVRLHVSFAAMSALGVAWIIILGNILLRKNCPTSWDRIATAWAGLAGGIAFAVASTIVCVMRGEPTAAVSLGLASSVFVAIAAMNVRKAYRWQDSLRQRIASDAANQ